MRSSVLKDLLGKLKGVDYVILDSVAFEKFSSCLLCSGVKNVFPIYDVTEVEITVIIINITGTSQQNLHFHRILSIYKFAP